MTVDYFAAWLLRWRWHFPSSYCLKVLALELELELELELVLELVLVQR